MGFFDFGESQDQQYDQYSQNPEEHKSKFSHELIAGAAAFEAKKVRFQLSRQRLHRAHEADTDSTGLPTSLRGA